MKGLAVVGAQEVPEERVEQGPLTAQELLSGTHPAWRIGARTVQGHDQSRPPRVSHPETRELQPQLEMCAHGVGSLFQTKAKNKPETKVPCPCPALFLNWVLLSMETVRGAGLSLPCPCISVLWFQNTS